MVLYRRVNDPAYPRTRVAFAVLERENAIDEFIAREREYEKWVREKATALARASEGGEELWLQNFSCTVERVANYSDNILKGEARTRLKEEETESRVGIVWYKWLANSLDAYEDLFRSRLTVTKQTKRILREEPALKLLVPELENDELFIKLRNHPIEYRWFLQRLILSKRWEDDEFYAETEILWALDKLARYCETITRFATGKDRDTFAEMVAFQNTFDTTTCRAWEEDKEVAEVFLYFPRPTLYSHYGFPISPRVERQFKRWKLLDAAAVRTAKTKVDMVLNASPVTVHFISDYFVLSRATTDGISTRPHQLLFPPVLLNAVEFNHAFSPKRNLFSGVLEVKIPHAHRLLFFDVSEEFETVSDVGLFINDVVKWRGLINDGVGSAVGCALSPRQIDGLKLVHDYEEAQKPDSQWTFRPFSVTAHPMKWRGRIAEAVDQDTPVPPKGVVGRALEMGKTRLDVALQLLGVTDA
ncbi:hypothetical protein HK104_005019, partial [Borealophlyctis nickersoniae]